MQTKLKSIFFLITLAATATLLYAANGTGTQRPPDGLFNVPVPSPGVITISPKIAKPEANGLASDSIPARRRTETESIGH